jgi:hypothetical protein
VQCHFFGGWRCSCFGQKKRAKPILFYFENGKMANWPPLVVAFLMTKKRVCLLANDRSARLSIFPVGVVLWESVTSVERDTGKLEKNSKKATSKSWSEQFFSVRERL